MDQETFEYETQPWDSAPDGAVPGAPPDTPPTIGRYRVIRLLGQGGFGRVYLAHDDDLDRLVAIKVPNPERVSGPEDVEEYLAEGRILARLDHPHIVPVYDLGRTPDGLCYVVSKYIEGTNLAVRMKQGRLSFQESATLVAAVAEALHHAHSRGLVHRDVKPANILIDDHGRPCVTDFGLALRVDDPSQRGRYAGTPAYMSPEQARGEGHRVDGRSDIFSLGVIFYELLTGRHPFRGASNTEMLEAIVHVEERPPRQVDDAIPRELERICMKALAKRASERYSTAKDLAEDLRYEVARGTGPDLLLTPAAPASQIVQGPTQEATAPGATSGRFDTLSHAVAVVPKGLRSFDEHDAEFFLALLPGPRDRNGLSETVRFWKARIEETDADATFPVGLIYGPSGCGKSSLVKAGLLPRLARHVVPIYLEANDALEARLLQRLRKSCPGLDPGLDLPGAMAAIRRGDAIPPGSKVVIVLDQFEQWLHANRGRPDAALIAALRQCDGGRLQAVIMVRDDFWMASSRFMRELEVPVVEGHNAAAVDLFTMPHARKVLAAFGRAYGALPERPDAVTPDQDAFLDRAVAALADDGKVIPVRLALFAEMVKWRPWTAATLQRLGGAPGVGATFLEETFAAATAPPEHRMHQQAVRAVLAVLLPEAGTDLKGSMRSRSALLEASGYAESPADFDALMRILDGETRLLTPVAAEGLDAPGRKLPGESQNLLISNAQFYQLTHDYLVPSIREWLARKQKETRRGRAELKLAERAGLWGAKPEPRQLPSLLEWLEIGVLTRPRTWTAPQRAMMRAAGRHHLVRAGGVLLVVVALAVAGLVVRGRIAREREAVLAEGLVQRLLDADITQVPAIIDEINEHRPRTDPLLRGTLADPAAGPRQRLHARLALLPVDDRQVEPVFERLLESDDPVPFRVLREELWPHRSELVGRLWSVLGSAGADPGRRFRAAAALARYDSGSGPWDRHARFVAEYLLTQHSLRLPGWVEALQPVAGHLVPPLTDLFRHRSEEGTGARIRAAEVLARYAADRPEALAELLGDAEPPGFAPLFASLQPHSRRAVAALERILRATPSRAAGSQDRSAKQKANAAIALLRLGRADRLWPLLKAAPDPRLRSFLIDRLAPMGSDPRALAERLQRESDDSIRAALLLSLGQFETRALPERRRAELAATILSLYRDDPDAGVHGAAGWLLRTWGRARSLQKVDAELATGRVEGNRRWYLNRVGQTMVVIPGPVSFLRGSPDTEAFRESFEKQHEARIPGSFAIAATEVTIAQLRPCLQQNPDFHIEFPRQAVAAEDEPQVRVNWYEAARYCNWLSRAEGIPEDQWCYEPNGKGEYGEGMRLRLDYDQRTGYRLPTESEWEYACRAGTITSRPFGESEELITRYAWCILNAEDHPLPVGTRLPNPFGLFDMLGNVSEWCLDRYSGAADHVRGGAEDVVNRDDRMSRGGSFANHPRRMRSATRFKDPPSFHNGVGGFRPARTHPDRGR